MKNILFLNTIQCKAWKNRALFLMLALVMSIGNAWSASYNTDFKATVSKTGTGVGYVYAADNNNEPTTYYETSDDIDSSDTGSSNGTKTYYAWAKADRGSKFNEWTISDDNTNNNGISPTSSDANHVEVTVKSNRGANKTNTGIATAEFIKRDPSYVTCHASEYGSYNIKYSYEIATGDDTNGYTFKTDSSLQLIESGDSSPIKLYSTDKVTLKVTTNAEGFEGWYSDDSYNTPLDTSTTYTYEVTDGVAHIYAKFKESKTFYGRLTTQIASSSIGCGGKIYTSTIETANPAYTDQRSTIDATPKTSTMEATSVKQAYHLYAQPTDGRYVFIGWFNNAECTGEPLSNDLHYTYSMVVASEDKEYPTEQTLYACFDLIKPYYLQVNALAADPLTGMVLVSKENRTNPDYKLFEPYSSATIVALATNVPPTATAYVYAEPSYGYSFEGWYADAACTTRLSTDNPYAYSAKAESINAADPTRKNLYAKFTNATTVNITYILPTNGQYTASIPTIIESNGEYVWEMAEVYNSTNETTNKTASLYPTNHLILSATPDEDYGVQSWTDGSTITTVLNTYQTTITSAKTLGVTFEKSKPYLLKGTEQYFSDLQEALNTARDGSNKVVVVVKDACVPAGEYTIPSGVTLLIPYEKTYKTVKKNVEYAIDATFTSANCATYVVLTLAKGTTITVNGNIEVAAKLVSKGQSSAFNSGNNGAIYQTYGEIIMSAGSYINLENGAYLYAWGRITGSEYSKINAYEGSTVYESFQITDYQGGTRTKAMYQDCTTYRIFPFSQYYIQNIETPIRFKYGAKEYTNAMLTVSSTTEAPIKDLPIIGNGGALFNINSKDSYVEKRYDAVNDRQVYKIGGTTSVNDFRTSIKIITDLDINTEDYLLPFTNNIVAHIESGELTINANLIMNADNKIVVADGAKINIAAQKNLFVYDQDDWKTGFVFVNPPNTAVAPLCYTIPYATTTGKPATVSSGKFTANPPIRTTVEDATLQVDGELIVKGNLYVSPGLANICSTGAGKVTFPNGNTCSKTYTVHHLNATEGNTLNAKITSTYTTLFIPAQLHNDEIKNPDYHYTHTSGAAEGDVFVYSKDMGKWLKNPITITWNANGGNCNIKTTAFESGKPLGVLPIATKTGYTFKGWFTTASGGTQVTTETVVTGDVTYYAQFEFREVEPQLDIVDADGTNLTINANGWASSGWPYKIKDKYRFKGVRAEDRTLTIPYSGTPNTDIPIVLKDKEGTVVSSHIYKVPFVYTGTEDMSDMDKNSIVFIKSGTLTVGTASAKEIYVAPGAELKVNGELDVEKLVLRTTPWQAAVLTIGTGGSIELAEGGQVYYSRIAPNKSTITDLHGGTTTYNSARYYQFGLPLSCSISSVTMSNAGKLGESNTPYGNTWLLKSYNESKRAANGISNDGDNWKALESSGTIIAGVGYEMFSNSNYYREFYFPVNLSTATDTVSVQYTKGTKKEHNGWNIITSPLTSRANVPIIDPATAIKPCWLLADGSYTQEIPEIIPPAVPFAYQTSTADTLNFVVSTAAAAPRRQSAAEAATETEWVHLEIFNNEGRGDETSIFVHPTRFAQDYKPGIDVAKQSLTASRAILYTTHAYGDMAFAGVADSLLENGIDIAVYSPSAQELTFSLRENKFLNRLEYLWLADNETGERTDLLMNDYTCRADAGTIKGRFVLNGRFKAPQISTGIGNTNTQTDYNIYAIGNNIAISGVEQGTPIYVFDAVGHMIYTTAATSDEVIVPAPCAGVYMLSVGGQTAKLVINK